MTITDDAIVTQIEEAVSQLSNRLIEISDHLFENPEVGSQEYKSAQLLTNELENHGFSVERGVCGMDTAFKASHTTQAGGPCIAFLAEYDALPEIGHGCGHNLIGTVALGAAIVTKDILQDHAATIMILGTPDEENTGKYAAGKIHLVECGVFKDVDVSLMVHPHPLAVNTCRRSHLAVTELNIEFFGKTAHASAAPHEGINALDALLDTFSSINALRQHVKSDVRIHGIITHGGTAPNVVPEYAAARFLVRSESREYLVEVLEKVKNCARGAVLATGAEVTMSGNRHHPPNTFMENSLINPTLAETVETNLPRFGFDINPPVPERGSTDYGNVTHVVPSACVYFKMNPEPLVVHSREFATATTTDFAHQALLNVIKVLVKTAVDVVVTPGLLDNIQADFKSYSGI